MDIERLSSACLRIQREEDVQVSSKERYIDLHGTLPRVDEAIRLIQELASFVRDDTGKVLKSSGEVVHTEVLQIRCEEVGRVLGRGGENIRRFEEDSGARLELDRSEGRLEIRGSTDAIEKAKDMVLAEVSLARTSDGAVIKDDGSKGCRGTGPGGPVGGAPVRFWVYSKEAGKIIGRGGETVRDIMQRTGAEVQVQRSDGSEHGFSERSIQLFGTKQQQEEAAVMAIQDVSYVRGEGVIIKTPEMSPSAANDSMRKYVSYGLWLPPGPCSFFVPPTGAGTQGRSPSQSTSPQGHKASHPHAWKSIDWDEL